MEVIGKLANVPTPNASWNGIDSRLFNLKQMNVYISIKLICVFKLAPDYSSFLSFLSRGSL